MARINRQRLKELRQRWEERKTLVLSSTYTIKESVQGRDSRIAKARESFDYFVQSYFPHLASCKSAKFHLKAAEEIRANKDLRKIYEWARGMAKSSNISCLIPLWLLIQERPDFRYMVLVSKSYDAAVELLQDLQIELETNKLFLDDFGEMKGVGDWSGGRFTTTNGVTFKALGRSQSPRGMKKAGNRPDYIVIDDIDDDEIVQNPSRVDKAVEWVMSSLYGTMAVGRGRFIVVGNLISKNGILAKLIERYKAFTVSKVNILDNHGDPSWPENHTIEEIERIRRDMGERLFNKEYMNNPIVEGAVFRRKWLRFDAMLPLRQYSALISYTDPSWKSSTKNDFKATVLVGKTKKGYYHVIKVYADQTTPKAMVQWHYDIDAFINGRKPVTYMMEANLIQDLLLEEFKKTGDKTGHQIPLVGDKRKKPNKFDRIEALQPLFERGLIVFNKAEKESQGMQVLVEQLLGFEKGSSMHDDAPDALEGAIWQLNKKARQQVASYATGGRVNRKW